VIFPGAFLLLSLFLFAVIRRETEMEIAKVMEMEMVRKMEMAKVMEM
jgi:hypothetical protein